MMMLRAGTVPTDIVYDHSYLTRRLYMDLTETALLTQLKVGRFVAWASMHAHPDVDISKAGAYLPLHFMDASSTIPYLTKGKSGQDLMHEERLSAVQRYKEYKAKVLQGNTLKRRRSVRERNAGIKYVGKKDK